MPALENGGTPDAAARTGARMTKTRTSDNLGRTHHVDTIKIPCANAVGFAERCVEAAHKSRAVYNLAVEAIAGHDDEDIPLRSGYGREGPGLDRVLLDLRDAGSAGWLAGVSTNIRRSAAAQARTAATIWADGQKLNARRLVPGGRTRRDPADAPPGGRPAPPGGPAGIPPQAAATPPRRREGGQSRPPRPGQGRALRQETARPRTAVQTRKRDERRERLTVPLNAASVRVVDDDRTLLRAEGFGDIPLKKPLPPEIEPVSVTLVSRRKRRHRHCKSRMRPTELEWTAHVPAPPRGRPARSPRGMPERRDGDRRRQQRHRRGLARPREVLRGLERARRSARSSAPRRWPLGARPAQGDRGRAAN